MNLLVDYVQPLTDWLQSNPRWSLFITFIISLTESLAIIGSIVPGSITMTAIGILAGSGIMRIDLTLLAAILGAVVGDSLSYSLGYFYSERLVEIWPFKKYPLWLQYGKEFFATHGGKSVLIGRFIGPLRSIIPVIAGILHMKHWRFLIANVISAIGWSLLYIMPGVVIGAASHELSTESATRLFILILVFLASIWLFSLIIKWLVTKLNSFLNSYLHHLWLRLKNNPLLGQIFNALTPKHETNHYPTASLTLTTLFCLLCFITLLVLTIETQWLSYINIPAHLFSQSFHTVILKAFFIFCTQLTSSITMASIYIICFCWFLYQRNITTIIYLTNTIIFSTLLALLLTYFINSPRPHGLLVTIPGSSFPAINLEIATAFYGFILFYITHTYSLFTTTLRSVVFTILGLSGLGAIYLGDYWATDVLAAYFSGAAVGLIHCIIYRKTNLTTDKTTHSLLMIAPLFIGILLASSLSTYLNFRTLAYNHTPYHREFTLSEATWWTQEKAILPIYRFSRIGKRISLLNIQYAGDLSLLQSSLEQHGWESHPDSFFMNVLMRISNKSSSIKLPLLTQLYDNKAPVLFMTHTDPQSKLTLELRIWESNYNLSELNRPLWIGSIHPSVPVNKQINSSGYFPKLINPLMYLLPNENPFAIRQIKLPQIMIKTTTYPTQPSIILIKEYNSKPGS